MIHICWNVLSLKREISMSLCSRRWFSVKQSFTVWDQGLVLIMYTRLPARVNSGITDSWTKLQFSSLWKKESASMRRYRGTQKGQVSSKGRHFSDCQCQLLSFEQMRSTTIQNFIAGFQLCLSHMNICHQLD